MIGARLSLSQPCIIQASLCPGMKIITELLQGTHIGTRETTARLVCIRKRLVAVSSDSDTVGPLVQNRFRKYRKYRMAGDVSFHFNERTLKLIK